MARIVSDCGTAGSSCKGVVTHALKDLVHQGSALVASLHQPLLRLDDELGRQVVERKNDCGSQKRGQPRKVNQEDAVDVQQVASRPTRAETPKSW